MTFYENFQAELSNYGLSRGARCFLCRSDFSLSRLTSFKIGGPCDMAVYPIDTDAFTFALKYVAENEIPYTIIGNGSNTIASDKGFRGVVFVTTDMRKVRVENNIVYGDCGVLMGSVVSNAARASLTGIEFANGIPGTLGGAVYMNAGAYGGEISQVLKESTYYDADENQIVTIDNAAHGYAYRDSVYMHNPTHIILSASFELVTGVQSEIRRRMAENLSSRKEKQPLEFPSAGSVFKRPENNFAGKLIEDAGLKGMRVGGAEVSELHAGFIVNRGGATASDVLTLIDKIKEEVVKKFGVQLECEIRFIGEK